MICESKEAKVILFIYFSVDTESVEEEEEVWLHARGYKEADNGSSSALLQLSKQQLLHVQQNLLQFL